MNTDRVLTWVIVVMFAGLFLSMIADLNMRTPMCITVESGRECV